MAPIRLVLLGGACALAAALSIPVAVQAGGDAEVARRSWINTLNTDLKAGISYEAVKSNPLTPALFAVADAACLNQAAALALAKSMIAPAQARAAVQRFDERYCLIKHKNS
jgi:hypothetical protein